MFFWHGVKNFIAHYQGCLVGRALSVMRSARTKHNRVSLITSCARRPNRRRTQYYEGCHTLRHITEQQPVFSSSQYLYRKSSCLPHETYRNLRKVSLHFWRKPDAALLHPEVPVQPHYCGTSAVGISGLQGTFLQPLARYACPKSDAQISELLRAGGVGWRVGWGAAAGSVRHYH
jgi:hypothetical protein